MIVLFEVIVIIKLIVLTLGYLLFICRVVWLLFELIGVGVGHGLNLLNQLSNLCNRYELLIEKMGVFSEELLCSLFGIGMEDQLL
jgi:hypothetical protein